MADSSMRAENMGITVREKPKGSGRWRLFYNKGGRTREMPGFTFKTEQAAEETAEKFRARLSLGLTIQDLSKDAPPLNLYALGWLEEVKREVKTTSWISVHRPAVNNHIIPYFGSKPINEIKPADVRAFIAHLSDKGLAYKTIRNVRGAMNLIMKRAVEDELVERNPVEIVKVRATRRERKKRFNTLTLEELHHLLDTIREHYPDWHTFFTVLAYTGMRLSEARGLRWQAVHLGKTREGARRFLRVEETVTKTHVVDDTTKTGKDRRVDLNVEARQALIDHHVAEMARGRGNPEDYVFTRDDARPVRENLPNEILTKACTLADLKRTTPGDLRHTYITIMLYELEEDLLYVIEQVGHSSVSMILDHYGHPERYHRPEKVDRMAPGPATYAPSPATHPKQPAVSDSYDDEGQAEGLPPLLVAVNLSHRQLRDKGLLDTVKQMLEESGLAPNDLELELSENSIMQNADAALVTLQGLHATGIGIAMDDFGAGYSSLSHLKRFPIQTLKIDRSLVHGVNTDPDSEAIIKAIIAMGGTFNLTVVAEGVETAEQLAFLHAHGCDQAQGHYLCRPVPGDDVAEELIYLLSAEAAGLPLAQKGSVPL